MQAIILENSKRRLLLGVLHLNRTTTEILGDATGGHQWPRAISPMTHRWTFDDYGYLLTWPLVAIYETVRTPGYDAFVQTKQTVVPALRSHVLPCMDRTIIRFKTFP